MNYVDLADDSADKAWDAYLKAEHEYQGDRRNHDKFLAAREAFKKYDGVRLRLYFPDEMGS